MTTLIGCRCKSGNIFSRALLIGRGLFLKRLFLDYEVYILCDFQRIAKRIRWWQIVSKPPVPIPNTVVKTYRGENTWRATAWKDSSLPASKLSKSENWWISIFAFLLILFTPWRFLIFIIFVEVIILLEMICFKYTKKGLVKIAETIIQAKS